MGIKLKPTELISRTVRHNITSAQPVENLFKKPPKNSLLSKKRQIDELAQNFSESDQRGFFSQLWDFSKKFVGFIGTLVQGITFSFTAAWGFLVGKTEQLKGFNWNITDKQIETSLKESRLDLARVWGGFIGEGLGWITAIGIGSGMAMFLPVVGGALLAKTIAFEVGREGIDELLGSFSFAIQETVEIFARNTLLMGYRGFRHLLKRLPEGQLRALFGTEGAKFISEVWGNEGSPILTFNDEMDEKIDAIQDPARRAFTEEVLEEWWESFVEAGFLVAMQFDEAYRQAQLANRTSEGPKRNPRVYPNKEGRNDFYILPPAPQERAIQEATNIIQTARQFKSRDLGVVLASDVNNKIHAYPYLQGLTVWMCGAEQPPWLLDDGRSAPQFDIKIPNLKKSVTWRDVKIAFRGWSYGNYFCTLFLNNRRTIKFYCVDKLDAQRVAEQLADLTDAEVVQIRGSDALKTDRAFRKDVFPIYPKKARLLFRDAVIKPDGSFDFNAKTTSSNYFDFPLWTIDKPDHIKNPLWTNIADSS